MYRLANFIFIFFNSFYNLPPLPPPSIHSSQQVKAPMGSHQILAHSFGAGQAPFHWLANSFALILSTETDAERQHKKSSGRFLLQVIFPSETFTL